MPYSDRWGITATKLGADTYNVTHPDAVPTAVTVVIQQVLPTELINVGGALHLAILKLFPLLPGLWENRYAYAVCRWKMDAYASIISGLPGNQRAPWTAKRNWWVTEEARLKTLMGTDA